MIHKINKISCNYKSETQTTYATNTSCFLSGTLFTKHGNANGSKIKSKEPNTTSPISSDKLKQRTTISASIVDMVRVVPHLTSL